MFYCNKKITAFTLAEMMLVMLILTIILAASIPVITKRTQRHERVVERIITIQVPANNTTQKSNRKNNIINSKTQNYSKTENNYKPKNNSEIQDNYKAEDNSKKTSNSSASSNYKNEEISNIETITVDGKPQTIITVESGKQYAIYTDKNGLVQLKALEK